MATLDHPSRRVAITGIGVVSAGAGDIDSFWALLVSGRSAARRISRFDVTGCRSRIAAECDIESAAETHSGERDRCAVLALAAARQAIAESGATVAVDPPRMGVSMGTALGYTGSLQQEYAALSGGDGRAATLDESRAGPQLYEYFTPASLAAEIACSVGAEGPTGTVSTACASGLDAVGHAADLIRSGAADVMLAGAAEAPISPLTIAGLDAVRTTSARNDDPEHAARPFDRTRDGFVLGEGAAVMVLEELDHARRRDALIYAEFAGHATRCNAHSMTGLRRDGREMALAIDAALRSARLTPDDVDYINGHGSATPQSDLHETNAYKCALGVHAHATPISSIKPVIGHCLGAAAALEMVACALAIDRSAIPPTANLYDPDPECDLDYVPLTARERGLNVVLNTASGFGGFQSAVVLTRPNRRIP
jgi:minimal PKS ketosynthase (KS/KS alpha)